MLLYHLLLPHLLIGSWIVAALWCWKALTVAYGLPQVPDLLHLPPDVTPAGNPRVVVIVPACNEENTVEPALLTLLAQDYPNLHILAVDDRSTDRTGDVLERLAHAHPDRLTSLTIASLPPGWLGKTHAMACAAGHARALFQPQWLLFTDADVLFAPDAIRRSLAAAVHARADHFVTLPTPIARRWDEAAFLSFLQVMSFWAVRLWRVPNPASPHDAVGVGAFALLRTSAFQSIGGFDALRLEVLEDFYLGRRVKLAGLPQRVAFGRNLVRVHWAPGAPGIVNVLTKNLFSVFRFRTPLALIAAFWLAVLTLAPAADLALRPTRLPASLAFLAIAALYRTAAHRSGLSTWNALLSPLAATLLLFSLLRSTTLTLLHRGVSWRGTFYPLPELRRQAHPLFPRRPTPKPIPTTPFTIP